MNAHAHSRAPIGVKKSFVIRSCDDVTEYYWLYRAVNLLDTPRGGNLCDGIQFTFMTGLTASRLRQPAPATNKQAALYNLGRRCSSTWNPLLVNPFTVRNNSYLFEYTEARPPEKRDRVLHKDFSPEISSREKRYFIGTKGGGAKCQRHREHLCFVISADGSPMTDLRFICSTLSLITISETRDWSLKSLESIKRNLKFIIDRVRT